MKLLHAPLFWTVRLFLMRQRSLEFIGPEHFDNEKTQELLAFRDGILSQSAPYLYDEKAKQNEKTGNFDKRSFHFGVKFKGKIAAYVRLTPSRFELSTLSHSWGIISKRHDDYIEFNRLVADPTLAKRGFFGRLLLLYVGLWLFEQSDYKGIVAVCRPERMNFLSSFGLAPITGLSAYLPERKETYQLLMGSKQEILGTIFKKYLTDNRMFNSAYRVGSATKN
jgi:hypothetical protein